MATNRFRHRMRVQRAVGERGTDWERRPERWEQIGRVNVDLLSGGSNEVVEGDQIVMRNTYTAETHYAPQLVENSTYRLVSEQDNRIFHVDGIIDLEDRRELLRLTLSETREVA